MTGPSSTVGLTARVRTFIGSMTPSERRVLVGMGAVIVVLHVLGVGVLLGLVVPHGYPLGGDHPVFTAGVGVLAYSLGLRHAFDADHIAAVDNTTRALLGSPGRSGTRGRPLSVGFWFSLGHSTVVLALAVLIAAGVRALAGQVEDDGSTLHTITGLVGASVSGLFLCILGVANLVVLVGIIRVFRDLRRGTFDEAALEARLQSRGLMNRFLGGVTAGVRKPRHMYPVGLLFGLGFDTATEVGLLVLAGGAAAFGLPFTAVLVLPVLFAAGMCLMDTVDGILMTAAYGWAFAKPVRKVFYNLTVTSVSVAVALVIGGVELAGVAVDGAGITTGPLSVLASVDLGEAGYLIAGFFLVAWLAALATWRFGRVEERWTPRGTGPGDDLGGV
ncbi:HoxN/HupN/NixA family nickel/cobalt transporter [uncultured Amnibacterium sp.]|uniref:HoxN/HupN/NixA family nickel/cobalt transporter n=1 Tax=uncultured Amnibacterium sp. TaxID=1631851 RepID=UPI0035CC372B